MLPESTQSPVHPISRASCFAVAAACALGLTGAPAAAGADPITLGGSGFELTGTLQSPLEPSVQGQLPPLSVGLVQVSLPPLGVGGTPPSGGSPSSPVAQPSSSPRSQDASRPGSGPPSSSQQPRARTASSAGREAKRGSTTGAGRVRARSGSGSEPASETTGGARRPVREVGRRRPSIATRIVDRVPAEYRRSLLALAAVAVLFGLLSLHESRRSRRAREDALADSLTGLANREGLEQRLESEWRRAVRYERDLGLVLLDLDGFKEINDTQGHMAGDRILREAAAAISDRVRETDLASRFGGDEFVVLCPETGDRGLKTLADGLEETLARQGIRASAGFTQREPSDSSSRDLLARADAAMYRRKRESSAHARALATAEA